MMITISDNDANNDNDTTTTTTNNNDECQDYVYIKWEYWSTMYKIKHHMRHENKVNEKQYQIIQYTSMATPTFGMYVS